jgi:hippurate hydrolase
MGMEKLVSEAKALQTKLVEIQHALHAIPELGLDLPKTAALVQQRLRDLGLTPVAHGPSGFSVTINGGGGAGGAAGGAGKTFLLRGDMDALPIQEVSDAPWCSTTGNMHACGHDFHTTMLLGAAELLKLHAAELPGNVRLMFQPGEEVLLGAKSMIDHGVLDGVSAAAMFHVAAGWEIPTGIILVPPPGAYTAASDRFDTIIQGKGGHGAMPHKAVDPLVAASHFYQGLGTIVSREVDSHENAVISVGAFHAGKEAYNVIPDTVAIKGTIRTFSSDTRDYILKRIPELAASTAAAFRASAETKITEGCPSVVIDETVANDVKASLTAVFGETMVVDPVAAGLNSFGGSEDFSFVAAKVPAVMMMVGAGAPSAGYTFTMHHPKVRFDENVLCRGAAAYAVAAWGWLAKNS